MQTQKHNQPFLLSFGFEFESTVLSFSNNFLPVPERLKKYRLSKNIDLYADNFTKRNHEVVDAVHRFQNSCKNDTIYNLHTSDYSIQFDMDIIYSDHLFNDAEFTVTYPDPVPIESPQVFPYFYKQFKKACSDLKKEFRTFHPSTIINRDFPYRDIFKKEDTNYYLLSFEQDANLEEVEFIPQCTIGVQFDKAKQLLDILYRLWYMEMGEECSIYSNCEEMCNAIISPSIVRLQKLYNYLFLFTYSFLTKKSRKKNIFVFRNLFSEIWEREIGMDGRDMIADFLTKFAKNHNDTKIAKLNHYFKKVHGLLDTKRTPMRLQSLMQTTLIDDENRFFIEYRGLTSMLLNFMQIDVFSIHEFEKASKSLKKMFTAL